MADTTTLTVVGTFLASLTEKDSPEHLLTWAANLLQHSWVDQEGYAKASEEIALAQQALELEFRHQFDLHFEAFQYHAFPQILEEFDAGFMPVPISIRNRTVSWVTNVTRPATWFERRKTHQKEITEPQTQHMYTARAFHLDEPGCPAVPSIALQTVPILRQIGVQDGQMYVLVEDADPIFAIKVGTGWYMIVHW